MIFAITTHQHSFACAITASINFDYLYYYFFQIVKEQNSFKTWFDEFVIKDDESRLIRPQAYDHYKNFCNEQGYKALARRDMLEQLSNEAGSKKKSNGVEFHKGYKLVMQTAPPDCDFVESPTSNRDNLDA